MIEEHHKQTLPPGNALENLCKPVHCSISSPYNQHGGIELEPQAGVRLTAHVVPSTTGDMLVLVRFFTGHQLLADLFPGDEMMWRAGTTQLAARFSPNGGVHCLSVLPSNQDP